MRRIIPLNSGWTYAPRFDETFPKNPAPAGFGAVDLPHTNLELPFNYFDDMCFRFVSCYKRSLEVGNDMRDKRLFLDFEGVMTYARVYVNGSVAGEHKGGYTPFSIHISPFVKYGTANDITIMVDSTERPDIPPFGGVIDYLTYGGIYREVSLRVNENASLHSAAVSCLDAMAKVKSLDLSVEIEGVLEASYSVIAEISHEGNALARAEGRPDADGFTRFSIAGMEDVSLWDIDDPVLYDVTFGLFSGGTEIDALSERFGFRTAAFTPEGFFLNGRHVKLAGLNRHQSWPYSGYAMPERAQKRDADILKSAGLNLVRTSHYPQSRHFLDRCDEIGLLVFEEIPGWQHIGDEDWKAQALADVRDMVIRDRNRPSVVIWGVRINESKDDHDFYAATNALARKLDPTRQTGGVRYLARSELLEDVYTMNDFIHDGGVKAYLEANVKGYVTYDSTPDIDGAEVALRSQAEVTGLDHPVPYLVTEYNGHMYPTKKYDQEERLMEHALRHARVQDAMYGDKQISGAVGWCAFDYNTHADFGSGDKICYHGVMDMMRIPKPAAYVYMSQRPLARGPVLEPCTSWTRGERSMGGSIPLYVFTNCDRVEVVFGGKSQGLWDPCAEEFPNLPHPPVKIDVPVGYWGSEWLDVQILGWAGKEIVARKCYSRNPVPSTLSVEADDMELDSRKDSWDATRVVVKALDQCGNAMLFIPETVTVEISGPCRILGPSVIPLQGGSAAFWVRTEKEFGDATVTVTGTRLGSASLRIAVK